MPAATPAAPKPPGSKGAARKPAAGKPVAGKPQAEPAARPATAAKNTRPKANANNTNPNNTKGNNTKGNNAKGNNGKADGGKPAGGTTLGLSRRGLIIVLSVLAVALALVIGGLVEGSKITNDASWAKGKGCALLPAGQSRADLGTLGQCTELRTAGHLFGSDDASAVVLINVPSGLMALRLDLTRTSGGSYRAKAHELAASQVPTVDQATKDKVAASIKQRGGMHPDFVLTPTGA